MPDQKVDPSVALGYERAPSKPVLPAPPTERKRLGSWP